MAALNWPGCFSASEGSLTSAHLKHMEPWFFISSEGLDPRFLTRLLTWGESLPRCSLQNGCCSRPPAPDTRPSLQPHVAPPTWPPLDGAACMPLPSLQNELAPIQDTTVESTKDNNQNFQGKKLVCHEAAIIICPWHCQYQILFS